MDLPHVQGLVAQIDVLAGAVVQKQHALRSRDVGNGRVLAPLTDIAAVGEAHSREGEGALLGLQPEGLKHPRGDGDVVDGRRNALKDAGLKHDVGVLAVRRGDKGFLTRVRFVIGKRGIPAGGGAADVFGARVENEFTDVGAVGGVGNKAILQRNGNGAGEVVAKYLLGDRFFKIVRHVNLLFAFRLFISPRCGIGCVASLHGRCWGVVASYGREQQ